VDLRWKKSREEKRREYDKSIKGAGRGGVEFEVNSEQ
jgi:hypothetical protein